MTKITQFLSIKWVQIRPGSKNFKSFTVRVQSKINKIRHSPVPVHLKSSPMLISDSGSCTPDMSTELDLDWIVSGLLRVLMSLDWILTAKCFKNSGSGPDLNWVNGKQLHNSCHEKAAFFNYLDFVWTWILNFLNFLDYGWSWTDF